MSIIIRGMDMPESCAECDLNYDETRCVLPIKHNSFWRDDFRTWEGRLPECPLVELPAEHGRLIDADKLKPKMLNEHYRYRLVYDAEEVNAAPTIIEAEGGRMSNQIHKNCPNGYYEPDENYTLDMCKLHPEKIWGVTEGFCRKSAWYLVTRKSIPR